MLQPNLQSARLPLLLLAALTTPWVLAATLGERWLNLNTADGSHATARHEASAVAHEGTLWLMGGRGNRPIERYDSTTRRWLSLGTPPFGELHHFQPVRIGQQIYIIGAFACCYPDEPTDRNIHLFDIESESWSIAGQMPAERARGSAGTVVYDGKIYVLGGNTLGHNDGAVAWFDEYDPLTGEWRQLPDAPNARDHFQAVVIGDKLIAASGRRSNAADNVFANTVAATDIYDFTTGAWSTASAIPVPRAGAVSFATADELIVAGGESDAQAAAFNTVEAFDPVNDVWRLLPPLQQGRHGGGGAVLDGALHMVSGNLKRGGGRETISHEVIVLAQDGEVDSDGDGLADGVETLDLGTDPQDVDTDEDTLSDAEERVSGSSPLSADSDSDGLDDAQEAVLGTHPLMSDSDDDRLDDLAEVQQWLTNPTQADSDGDGMGDADELCVGRDPLIADDEQDIDDAAAVSGVCETPIDGASGGESDNPGADSGSGNETDADNGEAESETEQDTDMTDGGAAVDAGSETEPASGSIRTSTGGGSSGPLFLLMLLMSRSLVLRRAQRG